GIVVLTCQRDEDSVPRCNASRPLLRGTSFWTGLSRRSSGSACHSYPHHAATGTWLSREQHGNRRPGCRRRTALAIGLLFVSWLLAACPHESKARAAKIYEETWIQLERGDLHRALRQADSQLRMFRDTNSEWHWRFTVLKGEILVRQGLDADAVAFLQNDLP